MANDVWTRRSDYSIFNHYTTKYQWFETMNLEAPYVTNCHNYDMSSRSMCTMDCLKRGVIQLFNAWPLQVVANESLDIKLADERNQTISSTMREIAEICRARDCPKKIAEKYLHHQRQRKILPLKSIHSHSCCACPLLQIHILRVNPICMLLNMCYIS